MKRTAKTLTVKTNLLTLLLLAAMVIAATVLYCTNGVSNLTLRTLGDWNVEAVYLNPSEGTIRKELSHEDAQQVLELLNDVQLEGVSFQEAYILDDYDYDYLIKTRVGLTLGIQSNSASFILNGRSFHSGSKDTLRALYKLHDEQVHTYYTREEQYGNTEPKEGDLVTLTKPIYIRMHYTVILILTLLLALAVFTLIAFYTYTPHNLFLKNLSADQIEKVEVFSHYIGDTATLSQEETQQLIPLINMIRITDEPCKDSLLTGSGSNMYRIVLKNGNSFTLGALVGGDTNFYAFNQEDYYLVPTKTDAKTRKQVENIEKIRALYDRHREKHFYEAN